MGVFCGGFLRDTCDRVADRCFRFFPCLSDPARRSTLCLKVALVTLHLIFPGVLFALDRDLIVRTRENPWYTVIYLLLFVATLAQYFITSGTSPGYLIDAQKAVDERDSLVRRTSVDTHKDNQLRARMAVLLSQWTRTYQAGIIREVMLQLGQS
ncbi:Protein S-acyltransferase 10 [Olea europaea subsp. europaea]|uniref:Protein S-acyltransferase 10 n=1 Tax=Olea europaea subsp. europaea TaxID=158383 RepID=A0A8S0S9S5_OLEEU|nr:Protein S-acyltransferase 10 [Olea europaea subsp. europaea]